MSDILPPLVEPENEILDNGEEEEQFLIAIQKGDINTFMDMLKRKDEMYLNIECKDSNGNSALRIAIMEGYSVIVDQLLMQFVHVGDALLRAVDVGYLETVKKICEYACKLQTPEERLTVLDCHCENDDFHPDVTPTVLAAQRNDFSMIKVLLNAGSTIVNVSSKHFTTMATDSLQKSVGTLEIYRGLASEAYITLACGDPVDKAFVMSHTMKKLSQTDVEFKANYLELAETMDQAATDIISHARTTEEIMTVLTHIEPNEHTDLRNLGPLPKLTRAIDFNQRKFVAHPNCQQVVRTMFYGRLAYLRDMTSMYRFIFFLGIVFSFPFMSLTCLYFPTPWVKNTIGCPYVRFMMHLASDLFFIFLLFADTFASRGVVTVYSIQKPTKGLILLFVLGIGWRELKSITKYGRTIFTQWKHLRDLSLVTLFLSAYFFGIADQYFNAESIDTESSRNIQKRSITLPSSSSRESEYLVPRNSSFDNQDISHSRNESEVILINRIANIPSSRRVKSSRGGVHKKVELFLVQRNITNVMYIEYLSFDWWNSGLVATSMFACSTVVTFLRLFAYVVLSDVTGPLQISIGSMIRQTLHFFLVVGVVLFAFSIGLTHLYAIYDSEQVRNVTCGNSNIPELCRNGTLASLMASIAYLYWSVFGLESMSPLVLPNQAWVIQMAGTTLYSMFYVFVVVVLLNALIAVMSAVYNDVEENADVEWKFASTAMWLGVLQDNNIVPPPFNLLPSTEDIQWLMNMLFSKCWYFVRKQVTRPDSSDYEPPHIRRNKKFKRSDRSQYRRVMSHLVERYVASKTAADVSVEAEIGITDIRALRNDLLALKFEMFQKFFETVEDINRTIVDGILIFKTSREANELFQRTEEIHTKVGTQLETVLEFKTALFEKLAEAKRSEPPPIDTIDSAIQTNIVPLPPPKKLYVNHAIQTVPQYVLLDADSQTYTPLLQELSVQTDTVFVENICSQTINTILKDKITETVPIPVQHVAIQSNPLSQIDSVCQTTPPPLSNSSSTQTKSAVIRGCAVQTNPTPRPPPVFDICTQITPPPSPLPVTVNNRATQTIVERRRSHAASQREPWRPFGRSPSPMSNSSNSDYETPLTNNYHRPPMTRRKSLAPNAYGKR